MPKGFVLNFAIFIEIAPRSSGSLPYEQGTQPDAFSVRMQFGRLNLASGRLQEERVCQKCAVRIPRDHIQNRYRRLLVVMVLLWATGGVAARSERNAIGLREFTEHVSGYEHSGMFAIVRIQKCFGESSL